MIFHILRWFPAVSKSARCGAYARVGIAIMNRYSIAALVAVAALCTFLSSGLPGRGSVAFAATVVHGPL